MILCRWNQLSEKARSKNRMLSKIGSEINFLNLKCSFLLSLIAEKKSILFAKVVLILVHFRNAKAVE